MDLLTPDNPVFATYLVAAALMVLKIMGQGWMTVWRMMKAGGGWASPEDLRAGPLNRNPDPAQLEINDDVDRSRRMHRNDLENIPAFLAIGLLFVLIDPAFWLAALLMYGFVLARLAHAVAYATARSHEVRATFYTVGSLAVIAMAVMVLIAGLGAL
ncbi:glutathione S-transferase [Marinicauda salina]|uniref:Microsomal glutathione S-transferase 1 n=1 Tax=Marinicauda salina TaxID=2135793 RepID=A0A2U2BTT0_9PROT|nr:MAPEG family protein [Marinicauda salina]PWE17412.1 glutathione S-transferase [Marinicauda salina]